MRPMDCDLTFVMNRVETINFQQIAMQRWKYTETCYQRGTYTSEQGSDDFSRPSSVVKLCAKVQRLVTICFCTVSVADLNIEDRQISLAFSLLGLLTKQTNTSTVVHKVLVFQWGAPVAWNSNAGTQFKPGNLRNSTVFFSLSSIATVCYRKRRTAH